MTTRPYILRHLATVVTILVTLWIAVPNVRGDNQLFSLDDSSTEATEQQDVDYLIPLADCPAAEDRLWMINTRCMTSEICCADLERPKFSVLQLDCNGHSSDSTLEQYLESIRGRKVVIYVHGNRMSEDIAVCYGLEIRQQSIRCRKSGPVDWVIWSWPSAKQGMLVRDVRRKAGRTDTQGLYLSWVLRKHAEASVPTTLIGFSFGSRVITGSLHALAGGKLAGRRLPGPAITDARFDAGLLAPAIESDWMARCGYHSKATQNLNKLVVMYNQRDAVLKRYWLLDRVRGNIAMGYSGPRTFAPRADGSKITVRARDCSPFVGKQHSELDYYQKSCRADYEMAALIDGFEIAN